MLARLVPLLAGAFAALAPLSPAPSDLTLTGKECRIKTDLKPKESKEVPARIDRYCENFAGFYDELGLEPKASNKVVIRLFARYEDYEAFWNRTTAGGDPPAAWFSPSLNGVVSYHDPDNPYLRQVLFHETSHQYMNRYTSHAPKWLNEGLAEYFEGWQLAPDGALIKKRPPFYDLLVVQAALEADEFLGLRELVEMPPDKFMEFSTHYTELDGYLHYATAWAMTWYFLEGPSAEDRELYLKYFRGLCEDGDRAAPFAPKDWDGWEALQERWKAHTLALAVEPENADDHLILAANLRDEGDYETAVKHYEKVLELAPKTPDVRYWLGYCCKRQGDYDQARPHLLAAIESDEEDPRAPYLLARIESGLDQKNAPANVERALELALLASRRADDESPAYLAFVARVQHLAGDKKAALKTMKAVLKLVKDEEPEVIASYEKLLEELSK
jgi:tetratricopeptide (TPR) repeat protein